MILNSCNKMLDRSTLQPVEPKPNVSLKEIAKEIEIYVTRKDKRGELKYVR